MLIDDGGLLMKSVMQMRHTHTHTHSRVHTHTRTCTICRKIAGCGNGRAHHAPDGLLVVLIWSRSRARKVAVDEGKDKGRETGGLHPVGVGACTWLGAKADVAKADDGGVVIK